MHIQSFWESSLFWKSVVAHSAAWTWEAAWVQQLNIWKEFFFLQIMKFSIMKKGVGVLKKFFNNVIN